MIGTRRSPIKLGSEDDLHIQVCEYLKLKYPKVLFRTDFAAGTKLAMAQAVRNKRMQMEDGTGWPDLFIAHPRFRRDLSGGAYDSWKNPQMSLNYYGLFLELKVEGTRLFLKDGTTRVANEHYKQQAKVHEMLEDRGYKACFAVGIDEAMRIIDEYLQ